jgi:predicted nucleic acid-binding protein
LILDAHTVIEALTEPPRDVIEQLFLSREARMSSVNLIEVIDVTTRVFKHPTDDVGERIDTLLRLGALEITVVDDQLARRAGILRSTNYDKRTRNVSLADCVAAATAEKLGDALVTPDRHLRDLSREIGIEVIDL